MIDKSKTYESGFNYALAEVLKAQRAVWQDSEQAIVAGECSGIVQWAEKKKGPSPRIDIFLEASDLCPVAVEVEFAEKTANPEKDAEERFGLVSNFKGGNKVICNAIAVKAPLVFREKEHPEIVESLKGGDEFEFACLYKKSADIKQPPVRWPEKGWLKGNVSDLADIIVQSASVAGTLEELAAEVAGEVKSIGESLLHTLSPNAIEAIQKRLGQQDAEQGLAVAVCVWLNALVFQEKIASDGRYKDIPFPATVLKESFPTCQIKLQEAWNKVLDINYRSIFEPAKECLDEEFPLSFKYAFERIIALVQKISENRISALVDVSASVFPKLSKDRKTAAAFYTQPEAAELLAGLCLPASSYDAKFWGDKEKLCALRIIDPACGTGTLLRAVYRRIRTLHERQGGKGSDLHNQFMSFVLTGIDINPIAVHLTAASLSSVESLLPYDKTNIAMAKVGANHTGSLELIKQENLADLFSSSIATSRGKERGGGGDIIAVLYKSQDLIVMNPPYSRTRGGQRLFDVEGLDTDDRLDAQDKLGKILKDTPANRRAGKGSAFLYLAHLKLKSGGVLASVLPLTAASQKTWKEVRKMLEEHYQDIVVVVMPGKTASLSADTGMGEMLLVARKKSEPDDKKATRLTINLENIPRHLAEATEIAKAINNLRDREEQNGIVSFTDAKETRVGQWIRVVSSGTGEPWSDAGTSNRGLAHATERLTKGYLCDLHEAFETQIPLGMIPLKKLFIMGATHDLIGHLVGKDPRGAFEFHEIKEGTIPSNPSLWKADSKQQQHLVVSLTHEGVVVDADIAERMRAKRSTLFLARNMRWTSQAVLAATTKEEALGGSTWTALLHESEIVRQAFALWANSTLGMLMYWAHGGRQQAGRSRMQVKALADIPTPDFDAASKQGSIAREVASQYFISSSTREMKAACLAWRDDARKAIDEAVGDMLQFGAKERKAVEALRKAWCFEPLVHGDNKKAIFEIETDKALS